ncbi:hypothetical protein [Pectobacterium phage Jarilo]|uniref:Uncharacterized protein n=1 Tax=Pectobacterium phage Jarilo TaxID=2163634 RepID=A0A2S1GT41_9CAUD|nr:hypothetical protein HOT17_gp28 [Pectobacterium phage Jarilo]AWD92509.1 hypothetical protein [Pectobacterium phage Jarilo]
MLKPIEHVLKHPNDIPDVPRVVKEYLQSRFNYSFLSEQLLPELKAAGHSEAYIAGVIAGFNEASRVIDEMEARKAHLMDED